MSHAYARNYQHIVFATKGRRRLLRPALRNDIYDNVRKTCRDYGVSVMELGGTDNHVHVLLNVPPKIAISNIVRAMKANSSKWMNEHDHLFSWQIGYAAFSVSESVVNSVIAYIRGQEEHHRMRSFDDEFIALLRKHGIECTPENIGV